MGTEHTVALGGRDPPRSLRTSSCRFFLYIKGHWLSIRCCARASSEILLVVVAIAMKECSEML